MKNDGATRIDNINAVDCDEILLFSDDINTLGEEINETPPALVYTITSSGGRNYSLLKRLTSSSNGAFIDLSRKIVKEALNLMLADEKKLLFIGFNIAQIRDVYPDDVVNVVMMNQLHQAHYFIN